MFIRKVTKRNGRTNKFYNYLYLVESVRTEHGPRQKLILNLGNINIAPAHFDTLARRIEELLTGRGTLYPTDDYIEKHARDAAAKLFTKASRPQRKNDAADFRNININGLEATRARSIGAEYVCHSLWRELRMDDFFTRHGVPQTVRPVLEALVVGRLIEPGSELHTWEWAEERSALYELCGQPLRRGLSSYYRGGDRLFRLKDELEKYLTDQERNLFKLTEKYYFFDLTNTYFEGQCLKNNKAAYGRSKEKRNDCKQVTLGLCVDELGFAKCSRLFEGNRNETTTLADMVNGLEKNSNGLKADIQRTVVMDAGIASEANISWLREQGYRYIVVNRGANHFPVDIGAMERIKHDEKKGIDIRIKRFASEGEAFILCWSRKKERKETGIRSRLEDLFVSKLQHLREGLQKPNRTKRYEKVVEAVGRLKEKYAKAAKLYSVEVSADNESTPKRLAVDLLWEKREPLHSDELRREGSYVLRTDRTDMTDKEIWETYIMLRQIEYSFLCMKSYLGLRPNFHRLECRMDTHMFISVLAYHFLHVIEHRLRMNGDTRKWATVRGILKTHQRITVNFTEKTPEGTMVRRGIRLNTHAEDAQREIYHSLGLSAEPLPRYQASYDAETGKSVVRKK